MAGSGLSNFCCDDGGVRFRDLYEYRSHLRENESDSNSLEGGKLKAKLSMKCLLAIDQAREEIDQAIKATVAVESQGNNTGIPKGDFKESLLWLDMARRMVSIHCDILSAEDLDQREDLVFMSEESDVEFIKQELDNSGDFFQAFWVGMKDGKLGEVWGIKKRIGIAWEKAIRIK